MKLKDRYPGSVANLVHCDKALQSWLKALESVKANEKKGFVRKIEHQINRLLSGQRMSEENFPREGKLPDGSYFHALKKIPIRGYCWLSPNRKGTYYMSHYVYKNYQKLKAKDTEKVCFNWNKIEVDRDEK